MIDILPISSLHIVKFCLHINSTYKGSLKRTNKSLEWFSVWRNMALGLINKIWKLTGIILSLRFPTCAHVTSNRMIIKILHVLTINRWILTVVWKSSVSPSWFTKVEWHVLCLWTLPLLEQAKGYLDSSVWISYWSFQYWRHIFHRSFKAQCNSNIFINRTYTITSQSSKFISKINKVWYFWDIYSLMKSINGISIF